MGSTDDSDVWSSAPPSPLDKPEHIADSPSYSDDIPGSVFLISASGDMLKLPIPSKSAHDPLNWTWPSRIAALCAIIFATSVSFFEVKLAALLVVAFQNDFAAQGINPSIIDFTNTFAVIMNAVGVVMGTALSTAVGRRPVLLASTLVSIISTTTAGYTYGFWTLFISIGFHGVAAGLGLTMGHLIILDATFIYERSYATAINWCSVTALIDIYFLPLSYLADTSVTWRPIYQVWIVPCVASLLITLLFVPESFFLRPPVAFDGRFLVQRASEHVEIYDNLEAISPTDLRHIFTPETAGFFDKFIERFKIKRAPGTSWKAARIICVQMLLCLCNPLVIWVSLLGGVILAATLFQNETQYRYIVFKLLTAPDVNRELHRMDAYFAISGAVSSLFSIPVSGPLISWFVRFCARRSGGTRHAEVYLIGFVLPIVTGALAAGLFATSITSSWPIHLQYVIYGITNMSFVLIFSATLVWLTEAFPLWAAASLATEIATLVLLGSLISARLGAWATPTGNVTGPSITLVMLIILLGAIIVPMAFWGRNVRQYIHGKWSTSQMGALRPQ